MPAFTNKFISFIQQITVVERFNDKTFFQQNIICNNLVKFYC